jgi:cell division protein ZapA
MVDSVQIEINGKKFFLKGKHEKGYIKRIEDNINTRIQEVEKSGGPTDSSNLMVLVALNLADDCLKKEDEINNLLKNVEDNSTHLINFIDSHLEKKVF